ncbi:MAG: methyltransferase domain-containing protein [Verrucomicrobiota bacterium]
MRKPSRNRRKRLSGSGAGVPPATGASRPRTGHRRAARPVSRHPGPTAAAPFPNTPPLHHSNSSYWESRYQSRDMPWEKGAPSPGLVDFLAAHPELPRATICVPGCGTGHDVRAWAQAGFQAFGCDIAPSAIRLANRRTRSARLPAQFQVADFLQAAPPFLFDWVFEHTLFCAIQPRERDDYVRALLRWLKPTGQYLAVNYLIPDHDGPPFGTTRDELWQRFSPHFDLLQEWVPLSYPNRTGLELMLWWRRKA